MAAYAASAYYKAEDKASQERTMAAQNNTGAATSSPWNDGGAAFAPNTNVLDRGSMPSDKAEAARLKSAAVMAALKNGDKGEADRLMGKGRNYQGQILPRGPFYRFKDKYFSKDKKAEKGAKEYEESIASSGVDKESVMMDKKEDDGVIR